ncbi:MAG: hypothetical protein J5706_08735, partial [Elusimicrobiales bacterium]|nr:hypothetical protein [Elusimicrobiales bacterium]
AANLQNDYISKGMIENAFALQNKYHNIALPELPDKIIIEKSSGNIGWRVYDIEDKGKTVILKNSIFDKGSHIIMSVSWGCEFAEMAMEVIITNPWLKDVFMRYGSILGKSLNIKSQWDWKQQLGINKVYSRYKDNEIKSLQTLDSPHFFFMQDGEVVYDFSGVFQDEENLGLTKRFKEGLNLLEEAANSGKNQVLNLPNISKENSDVEKKNIKRKSPFFVAYCDFFNKARDWQVLKFLNKMFVLPNNCVAPASVAGIGQNHTTKEMGKIISDIRFCKKNKKEQNLEEAISMFKLLKNVSPSHKVEFAQSIITKDGHIISAYIEGIEKDLGKAKAKKIAAKLAGQEPQFDTVCEISENAETGEKTIKTASKKGYFCLAE